ncbi:hypothetical protein AKJ64_02380 [candidate division MSBL1 archaeon SCGC-AAA259E17]|uniref:Metallo-beta-lactamase domain-containing protein n=1 Tax=candidate division MSBL1 archaeon SCGC-AAA259E17 TaxID=1698263 RepID=A0A133UER7_9EURY|nr:hypothetical protein AKJ64_02380 [candidate division MSBL1 archaeon SCGC-AAA259E17]
MRVDLIEGQGFDSNIFLVRDETNLLVDAGTGENFNWVKRKLKGFNFKPQNLDVLVNTHCHFDHAGGDSDFLEISDCKLMASELAANALRRGDEKVTLAENFGEKMKPLEVSQILHDGNVIKLGETTLTVISTPGHTQGSISLYEPEEKALFSGDAVFRGGIGRTDLPSSQPAAMRKTLEKLAKMDDEKIYPGRGPVAGKNGSKYIEQAQKFLI